MNPPFSKFITIKELRQEVNEIKAEVRDLRDLIKIQKLYIETKSVLICQL